MFTKLFHQRKRNFPFFCAFPLIPFQVLRTVFRWEFIEVHPMGTTLSLDTSFDNRLLINISDTLTAATHADCGSKSIKRSLHIFTAPQFITFVASVCAFQSINSLSGKLNASGNKLFFHFTWKSGENSIS